MPWSVLTAKVAVPDTHMTALVVGWSPWSLSSNLRQRSEVSGIHIKNLVRLNKKEEDAKVRQMTADEVKVMKRIHTLTQHKDLIRDILKIEVSENNPLTTEKKNFQTSF